MFPLENWIHQIVGNALGVDHVSRATVEAYQLRRFQQVLRYALDKSSFYRDLFGRSGWAPEDVRSLHDLHKVPFTEPNDLAQTPYRFLCISQAGVARPYSFVTSGTTGPQKKIFWSHGDLERIIEFMAAGISTVAGPQDIVQIMLADGRPYSQADLLYRGVKRMGATPVLSGVDLHAEEHLRTLDNSGSTVLFGYTGKLFRMSKELQGKTDLRKRGVRALFLAGEYVPVAMRKELQEIWGCSIRTHYGLTEMGLGVAVECEAGDGYHFNEASLLLEVIDPETGKAAPAGEEGELVFTTLTNEAMPLIRYRTHDISRLVPEPCTCGATSLLKFDHIRKRLESILTLDSGGTIYPSLFDEALFEIPGLLDYQATLCRDGGKERLSFDVEVLSSDVHDSIHRKLLSMPVIAASVAAGRMLEPLVQLVPAGALQSSSRAKKLIQPQITQISRKITF